jgi:hypothetical protein
MIALFAKDRVTYGNASGKPPKKHSSLCASGRIFITLAPAEHSNLGVHFLLRQSNFVFSCHFPPSPYKQTPLFYTHKRLSGGGRSFLAPNAPRDAPCLPAQAHVLRRNSNWQGAILGVAQKNALTHTQAGSKCGGRVKGRCSLITRVEYAKRAAGREKNI